MNIDLDRIATVVNSIWAHYGQALLVASALLALGLVALVVVRFLRSRQRSRWLSLLAAVVALVWTSEGVWEVARYTLEFPPTLAAFSFFVFEAMMLGAAFQAEEHRRRRGTPGVAGNFVWILASIAAVTVAANVSGSPGEAFVRLALPLAVVGQWWISVIADRDTDDEPAPGAGGRTVRELRAEAAARREATWTVTPRSILVALGLMRPGLTTVTEAERARRIRRMVVHADRAQTSPPTTITGRWARYRLRRLARLASEEDIAEVRERARRAARIVALVTSTDEDRNPAGNLDISAPSTPDTSALNASPLAPSAPPNRSRTSGRRATRRTRTGHSDTAADRVRAALDEDPNLDRKQLATRVKVSDRHLRRILGQMSAATSNGRSGPATALLTATDPETSAPTGADVPADKSAPQADMTAPSDADMSARADGHLA